MPSLLDVGQIYSCLPPFQEPLKPELLLGAYQGVNYSSAQALIITWVIDNSLDKEYLDGVYEFEKAIASYLKDVAANNSQYAHFAFSYSFLISIHSALRITYFTESGIELELARASTSDVITVIISYLVMLIYVSVALGRFSSARRFMIDTKFTLGIAGVVICICSIIISVGLFR